MKPYNRFILFLLTLFSIAVFAEQQGDNVKNENEHITRALVKEQKESSFKDKVIDLYIKIYDFNSKFTPAFVQKILDPYLKIAKPSENMGNDGEGSNITAQDNASQNETKDLNQDLPVAQESSFKEKLVDLYIKIYDWNWQYTPKMGRAFLDKHFKIEKNPYKNTIQPEEKNVAVTTVDSSEKDKVLPPTTFIGKSDQTAENSADSKKQIVGEDNRVDQIAAAIVNVQDKKSEQTDKVSDLNEPKHSVADAAPPKIDLPEIKHDSEEKKIVDNLADAKADKQQEQVQNMDKPSVNVELQNKTEVANSKEEANAKVDIEASTPVASNDLPPSKLETQDSVPDSKIDKSQPQKVIVKGLVKIDSLPQSQEVQSVESAEEIAALDLQKFIDNELIILTTPQDDDVILGEITIAGKLTFMNDTDYIKQFWDAYYDRNTKARDTSIRRFIAYRKQFPVASLTSEQAKQNSVEAALKNDIYTMRTVLNHTRQNLLDIKNDEFDLIAIAASEGNYDVTYYMLMRGASLSRDYVENLLANHVSSDSLSWLLRIATPYSNYRY